MALHAEYRGKIGTARLITAKPTVPAQTATIAAWLVGIAGLMPQGLWNTWIISVVHLRPLPESPAPFLAFPDLGYELIVAALDPEPGPRPDDLETIMPLTPVNVAYQFGGVGDAAAVTLAQTVAFACADGVLSVEPTGIMGARDRWARSLYDTLEHVRSGHAPGGSGARDAILMPEGWKVVTGSDGAMTNEPHCPGCGCTPSHPCVMAKRFCDMEGYRGLFGFWGTASLTELPDGYACWWIEAEGKCAGCVYDTARVRQGGE